MLCSIACSMTLRLAYSIKAARHVDQLSALQSLDSLDSSSFASQQTKPLARLRRVGGLTRSQFNDPGRVTDTLSRLGK